MKPIVKKTLTHCGIILLFFIVAAAYMSPALDGKAIYQGDIVKAQAMAKEQVDYRAKTGHSTQWNSAMFSGMPSYQISLTPMKTVFSPVKNILLMRSIGWERDIAVIFLYLIGFYVCLLAFGCSPWLSLLGALAFGLGSYNIIIIEAGHITKAWCIAMMAPILGGMLLLFRKKYVWGGILFTMALILQIMFNHIQITFYTMLIGVILGIVYFVYAIKEKNLKSFFIGVGILILGSALALGCNARHLIVNQEYMKYTMRGGSNVTVTPEDLYKDGEPKSIAATNGLDKDYAFSWSYGIGETYTLLVPGAYGGGSGEKVSTESSFYKTFHSNQAPLYWGDQPFTSGPVYFGAIIIFLFVFGLFVVKGPERWWLLLATILAILMSWGRNLMGFNSFLFDHLPMYNKFRTPSMSLVIANVTMVIMAVLALKAIFDKDNPLEKKKINLGLYCSTGITAGFILLMMVFSGMQSFSGASDVQMAAQYGNQWDMIESVLIKDRKALFMSDSWRSIIFILISALLLWLYINKKIKRSGIIIGAIACLVLIDLWGVDRRYLNDDNFVEKKKLELRRDQWDYDIDELAARYDDHDYRVLNMAVSTFNDSKPAAFHHQIGGYNAAKLRRYQDLIDFYLSRHINMRVLNMLNARYIVLNNGQVQRNPEALGNCWFVNEIKWVENANEEILALNDFSPASTAVVDRSQFSINNSQFSIDSADAIVMEHQVPYNPDYVKYHSHTNGERLAVFSEIYYSPDWFAYIDGKPAEYIRANYVLRAMVIPAGDHIIEFRNEAPLMHKWDKITLVISIATLLAMIGAVVLMYRNKNKKEEVK